jgi:hypothetical protein
MSNNEFRISNVEGMHPVYFKIERAQRFHPSIFCSWTFDILRFAGQIFYGEATLILVLIERLSVEDLCHLKY